MSRNIGDILCYFCGTDNIKLVEPERPITKFDAHAYFDEYEGMTVANAECKICKAQYLAWIDGSKRTFTSVESNHPMSYYPNRKDLPDSYKFVDMSMRSTFDDEPSCVDFPIFNIDGSLWYPEHNHYFQHRIEQCLFCLNKPTIYYCINYNIDESVGLKFVSFCENHKYQARTDNPLWAESSIEEIMTSQLLIV